MRRLMHPAATTSVRTLDHGDWRLYFYFVSQLVGGAGLTLLLVVMLWPTKQRKPRNPLLISLCFSWWMSTFPCLCILYYARQVTGPSPKYSVCLASAAMTIGQDILVGTTAPALLFNMWLIVKNAVGSRFTEDVWITRTTFCCLLIPYVLFLTFVFASIRVGMREPQLVHREIFYCIVDDNKLLMALGVLGTISMSIAIVLEVWTVLLLYKNRACIRQLSRDGHVSLIIRVCVFGVYVFLGLCLNIVSIVDWTNPVPDLFFSTFPIAVFVVFGTQRDIWRICRNASRKLTSSRSQCSSPRKSSERLSFHPFGVRSPQSPFTFIPTHSQRHLSLSRFNYSKSFSQSRSSHYNTDIRTSISLPLPATLRPSSYSSDAPAILIHHSHPELATDSETSTPTDDKPPIPDKDPQYLSSCLIRKASDFSALLMTPPPAIVRGTAALDIEMQSSPCNHSRFDYTADYDTSGSQYSYPPTTDDGISTRRSRWSVRRVQPAPRGDSSVEMTSLSCMIPTQQCGPEESAPAVRYDEQPSSNSGEDGGGGFWAAL